MSEALPLVIVRSVVLNYALVGCRRGFLFPASASHLIPRLGCSRGASYPLLVVAGWRPRQLRSSPWTLRLRALGPLPVGSLPRRRRAPRFASGSALLLPLLNVRSAPKFDDESSHCPHGEEYPRRQSSCHSDLLGVETCWPLDAGMPLRTRSKLKVQIATKTTIAVPNIKTPTPSSPAPP